MVRLAEKSPVKARLNADNYAMYIADTGFNRKDFTKYTTSSGNNAYSSTCEDKFGNCDDFTKDCCFGQTLPIRGKGDVPLTELCCAACSHAVDVNPKCSDQT